MAEQSRTPSSSSSRRQHPSWRAWLALAAMLCCCCCTCSAKQDTSSSASHATTSSSNDSSSSSPASILVVGSVNVDIIMQVHRLPGPGETTIAAQPSASIAVGGKGANQAVAAARLSQGAPFSTRTRFICKFGNDSYAAMLQQELSAAGVDVSGCGKESDMPSGHGMVLLEPDGTASSVVLGGSNTAWRKGEAVSHLVVDAGVVLLQREIPEHVNMAVAAAAAAAGVPVIQDVGGEDRPMPDALLPLLSYLVPNQPELQRLTGMATATQEQVVAAADILIKKGAKNVLVTLAERGSLLVAGDGSVTRQEALPVPRGIVVDATAAGDAFRAGFAVGLVEGLPLQASLQLAAAAGALAVSRMGAVPSLPTRAEAEDLIASLGSKQQHLTSATATAGAAGSGGLTGSKGSPNIAVATGVQHQQPLEQESSSVGGQCSGGSSSSSSSSSGSSRLAVPAACPYKFAARLNSMKARRDLAGAGHGSNDVLGWIVRQGRVRGLSLVDLNYPQHKEGLATEQVLQALLAAQLQAGAVCIRFPAEFRLGAFSNPDAGLRQRAVELAVAGCAWAAQLGAPELIVWSPYDGYDYNFQVDYPVAWQRTVAAYQALCDACPPGMRVSLEFKPTDESSRFSIVPSTGAALLLAQQIDRPNFGLTLDVGHLLMAGENPAQSVAMVGAAGKLFGMQLNDAHLRLGAEDGLAFGAVNPLAALELVRWMQRSNYSGHVYFDTFPMNEDPVREAEYNVRRFKALWAKAARLAAVGIDGFAATHDAMDVLEALEADVDGLGSGSSCDMCGGGKQQQQRVGAEDGRSAGACPAGSQASRQGGQEKVRMFSSV